MSFNPHKNSKSVKQLKKALHILLEIKKLKVKEFCLCPGSRNAPFTYLLSYLNLYKVYYCFEERSAAFFALGRTKKTKLPTALVTTSGTAVGELLPATMEAHYLNLPLILLTADRPKPYRKSGAPQAVEQKNIFSSYVCKMFDLEENAKFNLKENFKIESPIHINVCFDEPFGHFSPKEVRKKMSNILKKNEKKSVSSIHTVKTPPQLQLIKKTLKKFFKKHKRPLILVSEVEEKYQLTLKKFLKSVSAPLYLEPLSGLRESPGTLKFSLTGWEKIFKTKIFSKNVDSILRIGGVPTLRFWRDLEQKYSYPVLNISHLPFKALSHLKHIPLSLKDFCSLIDEDPLFINEVFKFNFNQKNLDLLFKTDKKIREKTDHLIEKFPLSEPSLIHFFSSLVKDLSFIFLGNSLPIREWDLISSRDKKFLYGGQKGVNGIDGLISNFLGSSYQKKENWCFLGDLSTLYDLNALWLLKYFPKTIFRIVVINNKGGKIFSRNFTHSKFFENRHDFSFFHWAKMFTCEYIQISPKRTNSKQVNSFITSKLKSLKSTKTIIEIVPSEKETTQFWKKLDKI